MIDEDGIINEELRTAEEAEYPEDMTTHDDHIELDLIGDLDE